MFFACELPDARLGNSAEPKSRAPVCDLPHRNCVHAFVDAADALGPVYCHERLHCTRHLLARCGSLVLRDLDRLHACAEAHGGVSLGKTTSHTSSDATYEWRRAKGASVVFGLGCDEEEHGALCASFDPGPRDETLVDCPTGDELA